MLEIRERAWIEYYKSDQKEFGYNKTSGGSANKRLTIETKTKIANANIGRHASINTRLKMSQSGVDAWKRERHKRKVGKTILEDK